MSNSEKGGLVAKVHPVTVAIISNHFTRSVLLNDGKYCQVIGALLGKQDAKYIEILNCFELEAKVEGGRIDLNVEYLRTRAKLYEETFSDLTFLGFYIIGNHSAIDETDLRLYEYALNFSDFAFILKLSPLVAELNDKIPVSVYEANLDHKEGRTVLNEIPVKIVSDVAERIGTDHAAKYTSAGDKNEATASKKLQEQHGALKMLWRGLSVAVDYLDAIEKGEIQPNEEVLRELNKLAIKVSFLRNNQIKCEEGNVDINDEMIVLLTMNNKISNSIFSLVNKLNTVVNESFAGYHSSPMKRKENI
ncbi:unnamed protein product [Bursaphelenchus xylophilus]|uniref:COP9 signalosome complex subunit 6 n=1 Tax=Bursaphelenchus xylophilus TaxID=6326 RepID=A0A1I7SLY4_BURXY|nr:unnamed protein product [Bursaphelenchus xylophilus]CAG9129923.1 unnamed protein product [Bursaphelenchus xylophilus]